MVSKLLLRGLLAGLLAGILAFGFARIFGEPQVDRAIAFETALDKAKGDAPDLELVSRPVQASYGLATGVLVYGTAVGGIFALVFAYASGRSGRLSPRAVSALIGLAGFMTIALVPDLKYPANPPAIGNPDTIGLRTRDYFLMLVVSIGGAVAAINLARSLIGRLGAWNAWLTGGVAFVLLIVAADAILPAVDETPSGFSAVVLWKFRLASLGIHAVIWGGIGLVFGWLVERRKEGLLF